MTTEEMEEPEDGDRRDRMVTHSYGDQDENGVDLSLLRANLKLTPTERWRKHQRALRLALEVRRAGEAARVRQHAARP